MSSQTGARGTRCGGGGGGAGRGGGLHVCVRSCVRACVGEGGGDGSRPFFITWGASINILAMGCSLSPFSSC